MSTQSIIKRKTVRDILDLKKKEQPVVCLTSYTAPVARVADNHADLILVGDSLGMVLYNFPSTLQVTLDLMIAHGRAVVSSTSRAMVVVDMPFGSYQESAEQAFRNAARVMSETGCAGVKLEGGVEMAATVSFLAERGVPVMGHLGLQPQSVNGLGGYRVTGRSEEERKKIAQSAKALEDAGAFSVVLECIDPALATSITKNLSIPTIGIGASEMCDGQILVTEDMLGMTPAPHAKFVKSYANLAGEIDESLSKYAAEVRSRAFPSAEYQYKSASNSSLKTAK